ncbi:MAG TPA: tetratricopeptide repeat protein [Verrucomicrobiae bacterium]|nr:tetratricopeptide repeat protein [Verrucomicrobiae bacterium]
MKRTFALVLLALATALSGRAQGLDDQYAQIFNLIQEADGLSTTDPRQALSKYIEAKMTLERFQKGNPDWNPQVVDFRLGYLAERIAAVSPKAPVPAASAPGATNAPPAGAQSAPAAPPDWQDQLNAAKEQVRQLQANRVVLEAKLKEALAAQPAATDPRELARAQERARALEKENELLKASIQTQKATPAPIVDAKGVEQLQQQLAEANRDLSAQKEIASKLVLERTALETRLQQVIATAAASSAPAVSLETPSAQVLRLQGERDELQRKLDVAERELHGRKGKRTTAQTEELETELANLRARIEIFEARQVPYSAEELALFKQPTPSLSQPEAKPARRSIKELSPAAARLVIQAKRYYDAGQYDQAESAFLDVLHEDPNNVGALANLAAVQVRSGHLDMAERNIKQALTIESDNPFAVFVLGWLRMAQGKYDDALDALGRAAKLDPQDAEVQDFIGLALTQKGQREPAETAFRKAIQIDPGFAHAHYDLAVAYINDQPPAIELARWHYQKALAAGLPHNPNLEQKFDAQK